MSWTRAIHLARWADTQEARYTLPLLLRRLIRRTVPSLATWNFPAVEQVQRPGFDGVVETPAGNEFVPTGISWWEMGVDKDPKTKAQGDFDKRTEKTSLEERQKAVFVFVTPRVWQKKDEWAQSQAKTSGWRDVIAYDANDLEQWLEIAPAVDVWFTHLDGRVSEGVQDLQSYWNALRSLAEHPLTPAVFTGSREAEIAAVRRWLESPPTSLLLKTYGLSNGLDFLAALGSASDQDEKLQNALIVHTIEAWRHLSMGREPLVLIASPMLEVSAVDTAGAVTAGHYVFVSGPRGIAGEGAAVTLSRQDHYALAQALQGSGYSEPRALALSKACCGSSSILKRLITRHPETRFPAWARDECRTQLAPFTLLGGWMHVDPEPAKNASTPRLGASPPLDLWLVTELTGYTREELDTLVTRWQRDSEPLFLQFGWSVLVASREDAWHLLGGSVTEQQLQRFRDVALLVLDEDNPAFELAPDQRWLANLYGKTHTLSEELRRSIVETLALMATYPTADTPGPKVDFRGTVQWVLERALPAHASWQRWASLGRNLMVIAEAAPDLFLARAEDDLRSADPELPKLFQDQSDSLFGGAIHSELLWALEGLAWHPPYLSRVAFVLARLAARDPGGRYANRPSNSLRELFLWWLWHTNASVEERIRAIEAVVAAEPEVGWKMLPAILPSGMQSPSMNTHMPRWRPWVEGWSRERIRPQIQEYVLAVGNLTLRLAGTDSRRWAQVIDEMLRISPATTEQVFAALEAIPVGTAADAEARFRLWEELRKISTKHEKYHDARWALPPDVREHLRVACDRLQPIDPVFRHQWLFGHQAELPGIDRFHDIAAHDRALQTARAAALRDIVSSTGVDGVVRLLGLASGPSTVGWTLGWETLVTPEELGLPAVLESDDARRLDCMASYIAARFAHEGWEFVNALPTGTWPSEQIGIFARCLPFTWEIWKWLRQFGPAAEAAYWRRVRGFFRDKDLEALQFACQSLLAVGRPFTAAGVLHAGSFEKLALPSDLIVAVLEATFTGEHPEDQAAVQNSAYELQELVKALQEDTTFDRTRLARIEWGLLPLLDKEWSDARPVTLLQEVEANPEFFVWLLTVTYRGDNEQPRENPLSEQELIQLRYAHKLLSGLDRLPGTDAKGAIDHAHLRQWTERARAAAATADRMTMCDHTLGETIARACQTAEGNWPPPEVAALVEEIATDSFLSGFTSGIHNSRGVFSRDPRAGGAPERALSERYRQLADYVRPESPKLAEAFLHVAAHYDHYARHEDEEAERERLGR
jgi:hypothetical protein